MNFDAKSTVVATLAIHGVKKWNFIYILLLITYLFIYYYYYYYIITKITQQKALCCRMLN